MFGVLLIVEFFLNLGGTFSGGPLVFMTGEAEPDSILANAGVTLGLRILSGFLFNLVPGMLFLYKGVDWADRLLAPSSEGSSFIEFTALLSIGLTLLGYYFIVSGMAGVVAGIVAIGIADEWGREFAWERSASSFVMLVSGAIVAAIGRRVAR